MEENKIMYKSIDEYILQFPADVQETLKKLRKVIKESAPGLLENIQQPFILTYWIIMITFYL